MKKNLLLATLAVAMLTSTASADALKNSLSNIMNTDDSVPVVDISRINLDGKAKPAPQVRQNRPGSTVIATANGHKILKKDADAYLTERTKGKITSYDYIPPKQQQRLLQDLIMPVLAADAANKELSENEKQMVMTRTWMRKKAAVVKIKEEEVRFVYDGIKKQALDNNNTKPIPSFEAIKERLMAQMLEKKIVSELMKDVKIEVLD
ncbi:MAG: hypothetical protein GQ531_11135 [Sulfurovum sp.]|nr:hypothetical protein [Sulfurovum sp.]